MIISGNESELKEMKEMYTHLLFYILRYCFKLAYNTLRKTIKNETKLLSSIIFTNLILMGYYVFSISYNHLITKFFKVK